MIEMKGVNKSFEEFQVLHELNLQVKKGSIYGLIGTNGAGKTTIIKHLTGVLRPDSGQILIDGQPVYENIALKERIGFIPDDLYFFASYSLQEMSRFYRSIYPGWSIDRFEKMVQQFALDPACRLSRFSKGMQKQAAFVLTLSAHPDILILDEPIDGLDPIMRKLVWKYVVEDVAERGMTVLVSSHNLREMEGICDSIGILSKGRMILERDLDELKADIHKIQIAFREPATAPYESLDVLHRESRGTVDLLIVRNPRAQVDRIIQQNDPLIFDVLPLSLEEIFIYELGGVNHEIRDIIF